MRAPRDTKRPNTHSGKEDKERRLNYRYIWVSNPLIRVPVLDEEGKDTGLRRTVPTMRGKTYRA